MTKADLVHQPMDFIMALQEGEERKTGTGTDQKKMDKRNFEGRT